jgi:hypothetical protein
MASTTTRRSGEVEAKLAAASKRASVAKVIRIDPSQVVKDVIATSLTPEVRLSEIEVHADLVREKYDSAEELGGERSFRPSDTYAEPVSSSQLSAMVRDKVGFQPTPLVEAPTDVRPVPFFPLNGKPEAVLVPRSSSDITAEWCTTAFRSRGLLDAEEAVTKISMKALGEGEGEFSELVLLNIDEVSGGAAARLPRHCVAKFSPPHMSAIEMAAVFGPEAHFYNDYSVTGGGLVRPGTLYVGYLKRGKCAAPLYCIIMESGCPPTAPTRSFKRVDGCDSLEYLLLTMRTLAHFHARWWNASNKTGPLTPFTHPDRVGGPLPKVPRCVSHTIIVNIIKSGIKALPHCFSDRGAFKDVPKFGEQYALFISKIRPVARRRRHAIVNELFKHPLTLTHGDAHLENIFFGEQYPGGCAFIDFGLTMFGQALSDVATVIGGGMPVAARREHEQTLVRQYHACLCEFGVKSYPYDECWRDYVFQLFVPTMRLLTMAPAIAKDRRLRRGMFADPSTPASQKLATMYVQLNTRLATALTDHKWDERVAELPMSAPYCCRPCC